MNNEQFTAYLQDESYLYTLSYEELKTLVIQYPYAANLRILLLKKAYVEQNKDYERVLQMAATYTTHRRQLWQLLKSLKTLQSLPENVILGEDHLELTALSDIERLLQNRQVVEVFGATDAPALEWQWSLDVPETPVVPEIEAGPVLDFSQALLTPDPVAELEKTPELPEKQTPTEGGVPEPEAAAPLTLEIANPIGARLIGQATPAKPKTEELSFTEWLKQFKIQEAADPEPIETVETPHVTALEALTEAIEANTEIDEDMRRISQDRMLQLFEAPDQLPDNLFTFGHAAGTETDTALSDFLAPNNPTTPDTALGAGKKKKKKKRDMHVLALRSLETTDDLISETLADILCAQEKYAEAIEMYEKLILQFPEKSDYFAAKIKKVPQ